MIRFINAKLNIGLNITARRPDGYHDLETIFYPVGLHNGTPECPFPFCDILEITPSPDELPHFHFTGNRIECPLESNLIVKAYNLFAEYFEAVTDAHMPPMSVALCKHIPDQAGLGGGSADATFTLTTLNEMTGGHISGEKLAVMARSLGADCPFFLLNEPAYAEGTGEKLSPVAAKLEAMWCLMVRPGFHVSTRDAFAGVTPRRPDCNLRELYRLPVEQWRSRIANDFLPGIAERHPEAAEIIETLYGKGAIYAAMSGSGSTLLGLFSGREAAERASDLFPETYLALL